MGIQGLNKLLCDNAPGCMKETKFEQYFGRKIVVDASMHIYQYMAVVGRVGEQLLTDEAGQVTSHIQGMFSRTAKMLEHGIKPAYVFDGKPPQLKMDQLEQRRERRADATEELAKAKESGDADAVEKYAKRTIRATKEQNEDCKRLLRLMGVPVIEAPSEAEAQGAEMVKGGLCYALASDDWDALTFGAPKVVRHLMSTTEKNKNAIMEIDQPAALQELGLTHEQFIDLCILCGCDYCGRIPGIGPVRALEKIKKLGNIEAVLEELDSSKHQLPDPFPFKESRQFFIEPEVTKSADIPPLKWKDPDEEGLIQFLVHEKNFSEERVRKTIARIVANKSKANQGRMESFFTVLPKAPAAGGSAAAGKAGAKGAAGAKGGKDDAKRKGGPAAAGGAAAKKGKFGVGGGKK